MTDEELSATLKIAKAFMDGHDVGAQSAELFYGAMVAGADRLNKVEGNQYSSAQAFSKYIQTPEVRC